MQVASLPHVSTYGFAPDNKQHVVQDKIVLKNILNVDTNDDDDEFNEKLIIVITLDVEQNLYQHNNIINPRSRIKRGRPHRVQTCCADDQQQPDDDDNDNDKPKA